MLNRHKNWLVHKQTACGKDFSNPFMVDNLPKIVGFSTHLASLVKSWLVQDQTVLALASPKANELTIPEQTTTGKGTSNPLMAVIMESLVKKKQKGAILELKQRHLKNTIFCTYTPYPAMKIRRISASSAQETRNDQFPIRRIHYNQYAVCTAVHQSKIRI
ncbi:hypothetical protein Tco_1554107 [Tanacetum coccineum]